MKVGNQRLKRETREEGKKIEGWEDKSKEEEKGGGKEKTEGDNFELLWFRRVG